MNTITYQPHTGDQVVPGATGVTELGSAVGGFIAGCGWAALAAVRKVVNPNSDASPQGVTNLIDAAVAERQTVGKYAAGGQSTPDNIKFIASQQGIQFMDLTQAQAVQVAGTDPVEVGVSNAAAFGGNDSNVQGHYVTLLGKAADGNLIFSDPNSSQSTQGQLVEYSQGQLSAANPFWFGAVEGSGMGAAPLNGQSLPNFPTTPPGFPGPIWNPGTNIAQAGVQADPTGVIAAVFNAATTLLANAFKRIGTFVIGLALVVVALIVAFHGSEAQKSIQRQAGSAAKMAAVAA